MRESRSSNTDDLIVSVLDCNEEKENVSMSFLLCGTTDYRMSPYATSVFIPKSKLLNSASEALLWCVILQETRRMMALGGYKGVSDFSEIMYIHSQY